MVRLLEDQAKAWLSARGIPVPRGEVARDLADVMRIAAQYGGPAVVKALVPAGRRGKAGLVQIVSSAADAGAVAAEMLGRDVAGFPVHAVYVEERVAIATELFLAFSVAEDGLQVVAAREGGVEIETLFATNPDAVRREIINPLHGFPSWRAVELWRACGLHGTILRSLGAMTARLYEAFVAADLVLLEINPLAVTQAGDLGLVGAMMAIDEQALFRHPQWHTVVTREAETAPNERERRVRLANAALPGGEAQYVELEGDIGLLVGGGGAGLYVHDLIVEMGGRPANHCVTPPTGSDTRKLKAVIEAIVDNPQTRSLLVAFNFAQMARADLRMRALAETLQARNIDTRSFPIVVRLFGAGEADARALAAQFPGVTYVPRGTSLRDAAAEIVQVAQSLPQSRPA